MLLDIMVDQQGKEQPCGTTLRTSLEFFTDTQKLEYQSPILRDATRD